MFETEIPTFQEMLELDDISVDMAKDKNDFRTISTVKSKQVAYQ